MLIVDDTLVPTIDHQVAEQSKNYRHSTNHEVAIDADTRIVVAVGRRSPGNSNEFGAQEQPRAKDGACGADAGGMSVVIRRSRSQPARPRTASGAAWPADAHPHSAARPANNATQSSDKLKP